MNRTELRFLLERPDSYAALDAASASGELYRVLPVKLFAHIGVVYRRVESIADAEFRGLPAVRAAVLVHEESPPSLARILAIAGLSDLAPTVAAVVRGFGELWKIDDDDQIARYAETHGARLAALLLFELAHEGQPIAQMERAAELGGMSSTFERWTERLDGQAAGGNASSASRDRSLSGIRTMPS